jgi:hypothetical protein
MKQTTSSVEADPRQPPWPPVVHSFVDFPKDLGFISSATETSPMRRLGHHTSTNRVKNIGQPSGLFSQSKNLQA